jgi:hypothetical protein
MNDVIKAARKAGLLVIHSPSDTMDFYENIRRGCEPR